MVSSFWVQYLLYCKINIYFFLTYYWFQKWSAAFYFIITMKYLRSKPNLFSAFTR